MRRRTFLSAVAGLLGCNLASGAERATGERIDNGPLRNPPKVPVARVTVTTRQPRGHTHTCSAGHTWDHAENKGHVCTATIGFDADGRPKLCGRSQTTQDAPPRMVRVEDIRNRYSGVPINEPAPVQEAPLANPFTLPGCANGNCPTGGSRALFRESRPRSESDMPAVRAEDSRRGRAGPLQRLFGR